MLFAEESSELQMISKFIQVQTLDPRSSNRDDRQSTTVVVHLVAD